MLSRRLDDDVSNNDSMDYQTGGEEQKRVYVIEPSRDDGFTADDRRPLIPEGDYLTQCIEARVIKYYDTQRLRLFYKILEGKYADVILEQFLNLMDGKTGSRFKKVPPASNYYKNWFIANYCRQPERRDRMPYKVFLNGIFRVRVRNAHPKYPNSREKMPEGMQYSVISYLIKREQ